MSTLDLPTIPDVSPGKIVVPRVHPSPEFEPLKLTRILVPTDFSEPARKALRYAGRMAGRFGAAVTLLHVFELPTYAQRLPEYPIIYLASDDHQKLYAESMVRAQECLGVLRDESKQGLEEVDTMIRTGSPHEHIVAAAQETGTDLIVIATHGYTGFKHLFLGSTAERVVRHAACPVLVV